MITSEIIINRMSIISKNKDSLDFNEKELHDTIDDVFKNVGENKQVIKKTLWYYIRQIMCCGYLTTK